MTTVDNTAAPTRPSAKFWDRAANGYSKRPVGDEESYQTKLRVTQQYFRPEMEVLEFGCGTGSTALVHAPHVKHILAIDFSARGCSRSRREKADAANVSNITFQRASIDEFETPDGSFDAVLGLSILHLLEDRDAVIAKVERMLKPGGIFVSSTVCLGEKMKFFKLIAPIGKFLGLMPTLKVFTIGELADSLTKNGFEIDHQWKPANGQTAFIIAKKPG